MKQNVFTCDGECRQEVRVEASAWPKGWHGIGLEGYDSARSEAGGTRPRAYLHLCPACKAPRPEAVDAAIAAVIAALRRVPTITEHAAAVAREAVDRQFGDVRRPKGR